MRRIGLCVSLQLVFFFSLFFFIPSGDRFFWSVVQWCNLFLFDILNLLKKCEFIINIILLCMNYYKTF